MDVVRIIIVILAKVAAGILNIHLTTNRPILVILMSLLMSCDPGSLSENKALTAEILFWRFIIGVSVEHKEDPPQIFTKISANNLSLTKASFLGQSPVLGQVPGKEQLRTSVSNKKLSIVLMVDGKLSINAENEKIEAILEEISKVLQLTVISHKPLNKRISLKFHALPVKEAFKLIMGQTSYSLQWTKNSYPGAKYKSKYQLRIISAENIQQSSLEYMTPAYPDKLEYQTKLNQLEKLETLSADEALILLHQALSDKSKLVRLTAIESLKNIDHPGISTALESVLLDESSLVRKQALNALAEIRDFSTLPTIEQLLLDENMQVRLAAINALADIGNEDSIIALASLLADEDDRIRQHCVNALGEIGGSRAILYLIQALNDPEEDIRANARSILDEFDYKEDIIRDID